MRAFRSQRAMSTAEIAEPDDARPALVADGVHHRGPGRAGRHRITADDVIGEGVAHHGGGRRSGVGVAEPGDRARRGLGDHDRRRVPFQGAVRLRLRRGDRVGDRIDPIDPQARGTVGHDDARHGTPSVRRQPRALLPREPRARPREGGGRRGQAPEERGVEEPAGPVVEDAVRARVATVVGRRAQVDRPVAVGAAVRELGVPAPDGRELVGRGPAPACRPRRRADSTSRRSSSVARRAPPGR